MPLNPPLTKGNLWQVFHLLICDDTPITFQHLSAQRIFETTFLVYTKNYNDSILPKWLIGLYTFAISHKPGNVRIS